MLHYANADREQGVVLIVALLYLMVITGLVSAAFECCILQTKTSVQNFTVAQALQNAEQVLRAGEDAVRSTDSQGQGSLGALGTYQFIRQSTWVCGAQYYQVTALGFSRGAQVKLSSILQIPRRDQKGCPSTVMIRKRIAWEQL